jgi:hypothetical protein
MRAAEALAAGLDHQVKVGDVLLGELVRSGLVSRPSPQPPLSFPDPKEVVAAAQAFADRARSRVRERVNGLAA